MKRMISGASLLSVVLAGLAGPAFATPHETPNGWIGACNMVSAWPGLSPGKGVAVQEGRGMEGAMFGTPAYARMGDAHPGNAGMFNAVYVSGNGVC